MRKYLQIIVVLGGFFLLVFLKNIRADGENRVVGNPNSSTNDSSSNNSLQLPPSQNSGSSAQPTSPPQQFPSPSTSGNSSSQAFKDGTYTGSTEDAYYGYIQVQAVISGGKLTDINFLQYPNDNGTSRYINEQALPILKSEALQAQSANVDLVSGASDSSPAFVRSLASALSKAK